MAQQYPSPVAPPRQRKKGRGKHIIGYAATGAIALVLGVAAGSSPAPEPRLETTIETVTEVPAECIDALDYAEEVNEASMAGFSIVAEIFEAAGSFDVTSMQQATDRLDLTRTQQLTPAIEKYNVAAITCRAAQ